MGLFIGYHFMGFFYFGSNHGPFHFVSHHGPFLFCVTLWIHCVYSLFLVHQAKGPIEVLSSLFVHNIHHKLSIFQSFSEKSLDQI